ncbi:MAG: EthD domain-containing protein [Acidobacteria bacterium]|nr:EthD domain-containing protein [Acidobacteriota bacterium]
MIKMIYCLRRLPHLSLEEFQAHWLEHHSQFGPRLKHARRYVQYHTLTNDPIQEAMAQAAASGVEPFDGFAVSWWDSLDGFKTEMEKSDVVAAALEDEKFFIDHKRSVACLTQEQVIVEPEGAVPYVLVECLRRRSELNRAAFQKAWLKHSEIGRRAHAQGGLQGYIQNHTLLEGDTIGLEGLEALGTAPETWDGVATAYFDSVAKFKALVASPLAAEEAFEDERTFIDHKRSVNVLSRRHVFKDIVR